MRLLAASSPDGPCQEPQRCVAIFTPSSLQALPATYTFLRAGAGMNLDAQQAMIALTGVNPFQAFILPQMADLKLSR